MEASVLGALGSVLSLWKWERFPKMCLYIMYITVYVIVFSYYVAFYSSEPLYSGIFLTGNESETGIMEEHTPPLMVSL